ncbi:hypothetical protein AWU65_30395 [Paenibacillus glucanolyticus]|uniref:MORN repeat-containing protein n=1 Tax=Paenibacillus glucanolyticus TaxID=59843 RepID=A0A163FGG7_9BACL|nr:hypothetical protein [Paenibacillus glucanolyticus]KZS44371.1 hypothetical protein AWU65_30395 [Paenibacillus glucanolyticus]
MQKIKALSITLACALSLFASSLVPAPASADANAASAKEWIQISARTSYYGETANGQPHGRGTIKWGEDKQYSGDFVNGKRTGTGKYMNQYQADDEEHKVVYNGSWTDDKMDGEGLQTHKVTLPDGTVRWNQLQKGTFKAGVFQSGYDVIHAVADPDYSFTYKNGKELLTIMGSNQNMKKAWAAASMFSVQYKNGSVNKSYSIFPASTAAEQRQNDAAKKYLKSIQNKINPHLLQFEALSKQVPLK